MPKIKDDAQFANTGAKIGQSLTIRMPNRYVVREGLTMDVQDTQEDSQVLTVSTVRGVDMNFDTVDLTMTIDDFSARYLDPAMSTLAANLEAYALGLYADVWNLVGTAGTTPGSLGVALDAKTKLNQGLTPKDDNRNILYNSQAMGATVDTLKGLLQPTTDIAEQYRRGVVGQAANFTWMESEQIPSLTVGSRTTGYTVNGSPLAGATTLTLGAGSGTLTLAVGDVFTVAGVNRVHAEDKHDLGVLQQFVVTSVGTPGAGTFTGFGISPAPYASGAKQNVTTLAWNGAAVTFVGTASTAYPQNLAYHKDAFTFVTADLEDVSKFGAWGARETYDGISMAITRQYNIVNRTVPTRIDVLCGRKTIRAELACRVTG